MPSVPYQARIELCSLESLPGFASQLADWLKPGDVVALNGTLGAGKTTLVQHLCRMLQVTETVSSPTFVLMNEYLSGCHPITHVDLYRLGDDRAASLADELLSIVDDGRSLVLVEWACYGAFLDEVITLSLDLETIPGADAVDERRVITVTANRPLWASEEAS